MNQVPGPCICSEDMIMVNKSPLVCVKCARNCEKCDEFQCFECKKGFSLVLADCVQNRFGLVFGRFEDFKVFIKFDEEVLRGLQRSQLQVLKDSGEKLGFELIFLNYSDYMVELVKDELVEGRVKIVIVFKSLMSKGLSRLDPLRYEYSFMLNSTGHDSDESSSTNDTSNSSSNSNSNSVSNNSIGSYSKQSRFITQVNIISKLIATLSILTCIISSLLNHSKIYLWLTINSLQTLSYLPLLNIKISHFLFEFLSNLHPLSLLNLPQLQSQIFNCDTVSINPNFYHYGFRCKYFLHNSIQIFLLFITCSAFSGILLIMQLFPSKNLKFWSLSLLKSYKFSFFIRFWIQAYIDLIFPAIISIKFVNFKQISINSASDGINSILAVFFTVFFIQLLILASPIIIFLFYKLNFDKILNDNQEFTQKYSPLIEGFRVESKFIYFIPIFFIEKIVYVLVLFGLFSYPILQIIACAVLPGFNILLVKILGVFRDRMNEIVFLVNESLVLVVFCLASGFLIGSDEDVIGYFIIACVVVVVLTGSLICFVGLIRDFCGMNRESGSLKIDAEEVSIDNSINDNYDKQICDSKKSLNNRTNLSMSSVVVEESPLKV